MNMRLETGPIRNNGGQEGSLGTIHESYSNADKTTETQLIQEVFDNPEQKNVNPTMNSDQKMREALARFKAEQQAKQDPEKQQQIQEGWEQFESGNQIALQKKQERAEKRSSPDSTSAFALSAQFAKSPEDNASLVKESQINEMWSGVEKQNSLQTQLTRIQEALYRAQKTGDKELVALLEEQEKNLADLVVRNPEDRVSLEQKIAVGKTTIEKQKSQKENLPTSESLIEDVPFFEKPENEKQIENQKPQEEKQEVIQNTQHEPSEDTLAKLHEFGIDYNELVQVVPNFANLSEGQQAYVLVKAEEQSLEHIQDKANEDFQRKMSEGGKVSRFFRSLFKGGSIKREVNRNAINQHKGLDAFSEDIAKITNYTVESGFDISLQDNGKERNYVIEYAKKPEGLTEKQAFFVDTYNRYATALSDIPYEWGLDTATKDQKKAHAKAVEEFHQSEKALQGMLEKGGVDHADILQDTFGLRSKVELNQLFSNSPDAGKQMSEMKTATWQSDLTKKILQPGTVGMLTGSGARVFSKALWGLGGAVGASAIIGGVMGVYRKNQEFEQNSKDSRRMFTRTPELISKVTKGDLVYKDLIAKSQEAQKIKDPKKREQTVFAIQAEMEKRERELFDAYRGVKKSDNKIFDAKQNAERIGKLLVKIENEQQQIENEPNEKRRGEMMKRRENSLRALEDRLILLDQRMKEGRVNFGKTKEQLENKTLLVDAMVEAQKIRYKMEQNKNEGTQRTPDLRVVDRFKKQARTTRQERHQDRVQPFAVGAGIGAGAAVTSWLISDWFRGDNSANAIKNALDTGNSNIPPVQNSSPEEYKFPGIGAGKEAWEAINDAKNPVNFEVSVDASQKGAIAMYGDLQDAIEKKYNGDYTNAPKYIQDFMSKTEVQLAMEDNMYRPSDPNGNESAKIYKGGKLGFTESGERVYIDPRSGTHILSGDGKFDGEHFDFKSYQDAKVPVQEISDSASTSTGASSTNPESFKNPDTLHPGTPWETDKKPWLEGVNENGVKVLDKPMYPETKVLESVGETATSQVSSAMETSNQLPEGVERIKLSEKLSVDFEITEDAKGRAQTKFHNVNLDNFNAYHKAYLKDDIASYSQKIANTSDFLKQNPGMSSAEVEQDLRKLTNQMIMRDQVLQEGGLDPKSEEYKLIKTERDTIRKMIKNNFEWYGGNDLIGSLDGNKYPDPKYVFETPNSNASVQNEVFDQSSKVQGGTTEKPTDVFQQKNMTNMLGNNTEAAKNVQFSVERDSSGLIKDVKVTGGMIDKSKVSLQEFGYNIDWQKSPEFSQTFKDTPQGKQLISTLDTIKMYTALRDTLPVNSEEYNFLNKSILMRISLIEDKYPSIFN